MGLRAIVAKDPFDYNEMVESALRGVVREALRRAARDGLRAGHHFYLSFRTAAPGVELPDYLVEKYPDEMTIVLQHQFWDLEVEESRFSVGLSFQNQVERLRIPFAAVTAFTDPSVKFGLQFQVPVATASETAGLPAPVPAPPPASAPAERPAAEVVALDKFRKR
jgi:uncharacterized protein